MLSILKYCHCVINKSDVLEPGEHGEFYHDTCGKIVKIKVMPIKCEGCDD